MAYISQSEKKEIASKVKPFLKALRLKGSLSIRNHSTLVLKLKDCSKFLEDYIRSGGHVSDYGVTIGSSHGPSGNLGMARKPVEELIRLMKNDDWKDESDAMTDYFNISYYIKIEAYI